MVENKQFKMAVIGECMAEISGKPFSSVKLDMGGDTMNTSIYLKRLVKQDAEISFLTAMGTDPLSQALIEKWRSHDIKTNTVLINKTKKVAFYYIQNDENGERSFQYWRNDSAAKFMMQHPSIAEAFATLTHFDAIFLSGISVAILPPEDKQLLISQLRFLKEQGVKIIFDGNYRPQLWQDIKEAKNTYQSLYELSHLALVTFDDEQLIWQDQTIEQTQQRLSDFNIDELVIKDGENGCNYISANEDISVPTTPVTHVVDTTAAGDSFNAGFLAGWIKQQTPKRCCQMGNALAGQVIQQQGSIVDVTLEL